MNMTKQKPNKTNPNRLASGIKLSLLAVACLSTAAVAGGSNQYGQSYAPSANVEHDFARVISVQPIIDFYQVSVPVEQCYPERVPRDRHANYRGKQTRTPEIVGALIGAAVGRKFGSGRGKDVATVAGAVLGGSIGRDVKNSARQRDRRYGNEYDRAYEGGYGGAYGDGRGDYQTVSRCEVTQEYRDEEQIVGYDVSYKYNGHVYQTRMPYDPGEKIKVKVTVQPV